jgi:hypothetical protein
MPNVVVTDLQINASTNTLVAATFGRGVWQSPPYNIASVENVSANNESLNIYPNPASGIINLKCFIQGTGNYSMNLSNVLGQTIYSRNIIISGNYKGSIDVSSFTKGIYFLSLKGSSGTEMVKKLLVN